LEVRLFYGSEIVAINKSVPNTFSVDYIMKNIFKTAFAMVFLVSICIVSKTQAQTDHKNLVTGDLMPAFKLTDQDGKVFNSADYVGKSFLVVYFYPKDESMVCTKEACSFRDSFDEFTKAGAKVIGINGGTVASHKEFRDHYKLPFILLADPDNKVYHMFGVKNVMFMSGRETFVIDLHGKIAFTYTSMMSGKEHSDDALAFIKAHSK
jgi:peroxiredoxin Q/BCP